MRLQFTIKENEEIEARREKNENYEGIVIPLDLQDKVITVGFHISDIYKFNMFLEKFIADQQNKNENTTGAELKSENITEAIGAELAVAMARPPIAPEDLLSMRNFIDEILFGVKNKEEAKIEEVKENEVSDDVQIDEKPEIVDDDSNNS